jgi:hypothetical protein
VASTRAFHSSRSGSYIESPVPTGGLEASKTLRYRAQWLGVANDVLNDVGMPGLVACHPALSQWYGTVPLRH